MGWTGITPEKAFFETEQVSYRYVWYEINSPMTETGFVRITHKTLRQSNRVYDLDCDYSARSEKKTQITYPIKLKKKFKPYKQPSSHGMINSL